MYLKLKSTQTFLLIIVNNKQKEEMIMKRTFKHLLSLIAVVAVLFALGTEAMAAKKSKTLKNTIKKGFVRCGVSQGLPGFSNADAAGNWTGVDVDVCRAVAAAVLGDSGKVKFTPLSAK